MSARVLISADDLTGGNACAAGFARRGLRAVTTSMTGPSNTLPDFGDRFDTIVVTTDSRHFTPEGADAITRAAVRAGWPAALLGCRIDTTLRGNVGPSAAALIDEVRRLSHDRAVGLCIPAFPQADRVTVEGRQLLGGKPLEMTELARDVRTPVHTSCVQDILAEHTDLKTALLPLHFVSGPQDQLVEEISRLLEQDDLDVIVSDALLLEHIEAVARAAVLAGPDIRWVGIDPGPGSLALASALDIRGAAPRGRVLAVSGSASDLTMSQLQRFISERNPVVVRPVFTPGSSVLPDIRETTTAILEALAAAPPESTVLYAHTLDPSDLVPISDFEAEELPRTIGTIVRNVLETSAIDGVYSTGGDITASILDQLDSDGVEIHGEVIPLAVQGEIVGGPWAGLSIVTKGGLIGNVETAIQCIDELREVASKRANWVRAAAQAPDNNM